ncbi:hypothetical protein GTZ99_07485 [Novosphingobium sp. FSY-8]|uniref:Uncharacterized protein n=1 Tax=Novosphingobium ovatum TaxID=1908523 RepID=A0ABW9XCX1_9SPHN|nr:hypothetical protein [Novosphingobium ovatum]NBC36394.1 hypothetical protein [Novosphingobium ovatum]
MFRVATNQWKKALVRALAAGWMLAIAAMPANAAPARIAVMMPLPSRQAVSAAPAITLTSAIHVERTTPAGRRLDSLTKGNTALNHGDRIVTFLRWRHEAAAPVGGTGGFVIVTPLPRALIWQGSADGREEVSVDGGYSWGRLARLTLFGRPARPEDVTHMRWHITPAQARGGQGRITYAALLR